MGVVEKAPSQAAWFRLAERRQSRFYGELE
jgi:hypothetical protein